MPFDKTEGGKVDDHAPQEDTLVEIMELEIAVDRNSGQRSLIRPAESRKARPLVKSIRVGLGKIYGRVPERPLC